MKKFVAVRTKYYKRKKADSLEWHIARDNKSKNTASVFDEYSNNNIHCELRTRRSCRAEYKVMNGRKTRSDFNEVFEHLLIFSEEQYAHLESKYKDKHPDYVKNAISKLINEYGQQIKEKYGFEPLRYDLHCDEGFLDEDGKLKRNIHAHFMFFNYDFKNKFSPLKKIQLKVKDENGKNNVNPAFADFQDIAASIFKRAGFVRGVKKSVTDAVHKKRDLFIINQQKLKLRKLLKIDKLYTNAKNKLSELKKDLPAWLKSLNAIALIAEKKAQKIADNLDFITDELAGETAEIEEFIDSAEEKIKPPETQKITPKRKRRRRKK